MITSLSLENFKRHANTVLKLAPLTVLVGPNGSGKTSVLEALHWLSQLYEKPFDKLFRGPRDPGALARHAIGVNQFVLDAMGTHDREHRSLRLEVSRQRIIQVDEEGEHELEDWSAIGFVRPPMVDSSPRTDLGSGHSLRGMGYGDHWPELRNAVLLHLDAHRVSAPSAANARARVEYHGSNVATVLANMKLGDEARFEQICAQLRRVVPQFKSLRVVPTTIHADANHRESGFELVFQMDSGAGIPATQVSEGTLLTLALITTLHARTRPRLLLLDDIHEALHPKAQAELMALLGELVRGPDAVQIIATTHSPYIVDCVPPEAVLVFAHRPDGTSAVRPLSEHPEIARFRGKMSSGQLWTLDDETHWVIGNTP